MFSKLIDLHNLTGIMEGIDIVILYKGFDYALDFALPHRVQGRVSHAVLRDLELAAAGSYEHARAAALVEGAAGYLLRYLGDSGVEDLVQGFR